jgi:cytochrome c556
MRKAISAAALLAVLLAGAVAAAGKPAVQQGSGEGLEAVATIQQIMQNLIDPSADALWASVSSTTTASGTQNNQPRTEEDWKAVQRYAVTLVEAPNLLVTPGRRVASSAGKLEDAQVKGILRPEEIDQRIAGDRRAFVERARALQLAAREALAAADTRDVARLFAAGGALDTACESCHVKYWYPDDTRPPPPANPNLSPLK